MKTELNSSSTSTSNVWPSNEELPHLTHEEYLPIIGSCQVSSILSNLEVSDKVLQQNVELPQNMDLIVLQNSNFKITEEDNLNSTSDYVIIKENKSLESSVSSTKPQSINKEKKKNSAKFKDDISYIFCNLCPFLATNDIIMSTHMTNVHKNGVAVKLNKLKCPGCANIFYHRISLRSHLICDHGIANPELLSILQSVIYNSKRRLNGKLHSEAKPIIELIELKTEIDVKNVNIQDKIVENVSPEELVKSVPLNNNVIAVKTLTSQIEIHKEQINDTSVIDIQNAVILKTNEAKISNNYVKKPINSSHVSKIINDKKTQKCIMPGCKVKFEDLEKISYHIKCHTKDNYQCPECLVNFEFWNILAGHLWRIHKIDMELFSCDKCNYKTYSLAKLNNIHKLIHSDIKAFACDLCKKSFKNSKQLRNHKTTHKQKNDDTACFCEYCKKPFNDKRQLKIHIDGVHKKIKPFLCSFCGYKGATRGSLKSHIRQHTGEKPFACNNCTFTTSDHNSLRRHKLRHTGQKPYKCSHCDYACIQSSTYKVHLKTKHPGLEKELLFSCQECSFRTINKDIYVSHLSTVHKQ